MKRIAFWGVLAASLILLQPVPASVAEDKTATGWKTLGDFKVLRLWQEPQGPQWPQIALLQVSSDRLKELQNDPLAFYKKYDIFNPSHSDHDQGHFVLRFGEYSAESKDPAIVVIAHDVGTYSGFGAFEVANIK